MLINLNEAEVKFVLYSIREMAAKLEGKINSEAKLSSIVEVMKPVTASTVRLTKAGKPYKKPGRKPGKKSVVNQPEQQAA